MNNILFKDQNTPNWIKLWRYDELDDHEFKSLLQTVEEEYHKRIFNDVDAIKHIVDLFLLFSENGLYDKDKSTICLIASTSLNILL
jgi:hypothetical protein